HRNWDGDAADWCGRREWWRGQRSSCWNCRALMKRTSTSVPKADPSAPLDALCRRAGHRLGAWRRQRFGVASSGFSVGTALLLSDNTEQRTLNAEHVRLLLLVIADHLEVFLRVFVE